MSEKIKPALTPDEWDEAFVDVHSDDPFARLPEGKPIAPAEEAQEFYAKPHKVAALCLYGQPFGFTHEDVRLLRGAAHMAEFGSDEGADIAERDRLNSLADRIEALLPPKP